MCLFHSWESIYKEYNYYFLDEPIKRYTIAYQICKKCGKAKEYWGDTLDNDKISVLKSKIIEKDGKKIINFRRPKPNLISKCLT